MKRLFEEIVSSKKEVKNSIAASESRVLLELHTLRSKVASLSEENEKLKKRVETAERNSRRNNLIIFGLTKPSAGDPLDYIREKIHLLLGITVTESDINDYREIFLNAKKLKGTGVSIAHDLTVTQREELRILKTFLLQARGDGTEKSYIRGNELVIGLRSYTLQELQESKEIIASNSAPPTPSSTAKNRSDNSESEIEDNCGDSALAEQSTSGKKNTDHKTPKNQTFKTKKIPTKTTAKGGMKLRNGPNGN